MAEQQGNTTDAPETGSPLTRPAFLIAAVVVLVIVLLGIIVAVRVAGSDAAAPQPASTITPSPSDPATTSSVPTDSEASVCGLSGSADSGTVDAAPAASWEYEGTTAYPTSREFGPSKTATEGYRFCFQHTPAGAVFAASNALAQGTSSDVAKIESWAAYFVSEGSGREQLLDQLNEPRSDSTGIRMTIVGFKVLSYTAEGARVDVAVQTSGSAQTVYASAVYELTWQEGDWKLNSDAATPFNFATVPNIDGYVPWGA